MKHILTLTLFFFVAQQAVPLPAAETLSPPLTTSTTLPLNSAAPSLLSGTLPTTHIHKGYYSNFDENPYVTEEMWRKVKPYLIPKKHPVKLFLDKLFSRNNIIKNETSFRNAGFVTVSRKTSSYVRVSRHPKLSGYLLKVYLNDEQRRRGGKQTWKAFVDRCKGAENIRKLIKKKGLAHFSVPKKWIYPIPTTSSLLASGKETNAFLLVVTDMELSSFSESKRAWREDITTQHLDELYLILSNGYASTFLSGNIPLTQSGKFSCVDTEFPKRRLDYTKVYKYLSPEMQEYWRLLVEHR